MSKTKVNSFIKEFKARLTGDDATATAEKAWRQSSNALKAEIASSEGDLITYEDAVEQAKERLASAAVNGGKEITDRRAYVTALIEAKNRLTKAEEELEAYEERIAFLQGQLKSLSTEVEA